MAQPKINFNNLNMKDLLTKDDVEKLRDLWPYLRCTSCGELMIVPKMCISCCKNLCSKCHKKTCNHETIICRHLKSILENNYFRCKFFNEGCNDEKFYDYFKLKTHAENCESFIKEYCQKSNSNTDFKVAENQAQDQLSRILNNIDNKMSNSQFTSSTYNYTPINLGNLTNYGALNLGNSILDSSSSQMSFTCSCGKCFNGLSLKEDYLNHKKICLGKKEYDFNQKEEENTLLKEKLISDFMLKIQKLQKSFGESAKQKQNDFIVKVKFVLGQFQEDLERKDKQISENEKEIKDYYKHASFDKNYVPEQILLANYDYVNLTNENKDLVEKNVQLENQLEGLICSFNDNKQNGEQNLKNLAGNFKNKLQQYETEESWLKEAISQYNPGIIASVFSDTDACSLCKKVNVNIKKFYCQECMKRFCAGSCAKLCSTSSCAKISKYICPDCTPKCGLCRKNVYCMDCKKSCFYSECKNVFCQECFKKNSHQQRSSSNNCAFFTCENDKVKACLMTSLFCVKCEKRLCNNCVFNDKDHFQYLFK